MYLKQKGLKISGSNAELIDGVLTHARGNLSVRDAVEDEESPNSCEDDTSSESILVILMTLQMKDQGRIQEVFFRRGFTRLLLYFNTNKPHAFFLFFF